MAKMNSIGVSAKNIDRIFAGAIRRIAEGEDEFSCCAITRIVPFTKDKTKVKEFYVEVLEARHPKGWKTDLLMRVVNHVGSKMTNESQGFRILMLSLVKAAWRDLV